LRDTLKHGAWLNWTEVEWSVLGGRCIDDIKTRASEIAAREKARNAAKVTIIWRATDDDAHQAGAALPHAITS